MNLPKIKISTGKFDATFYAGDDDSTMSYLGTRFDRAGVSASIKFNGVEYFGKWTNQSDKTFHDAISGAVEEFSQIGYDSAKVGDSFLKIGVGILQKDSDLPYNFRYTYPVINSGERVVEEIENGIKFLHTLQDAQYSYVYQKTITFDERLARMTIAHELKNTGSSTICTSVYNHNFLTFAGNINTTTNVKSTFDWNGEQIAGFNNLAEINANKIALKSEIPEGEFVLLKNIETPNTVEAYDILAESKVDEKLCQVRMTSDKPNSKMNFWTSQTCVCPEPFTDINIKPNDLFTWNIYYDFK